MKKNLKQNLEEIRVSQKTLTDKESLVGDSYTNAFLDYCAKEKIKAKNVRIEKCDAYWITKNHNILVEYKYDVDMENDDERAKVLAQVIAYYRAIAVKGQERSASCIFVADVNECFALHTNYINKFVNLPGVNWKRAPSSMGNDAVLVNAIKNDSAIAVKHVIFNTSDPDFSEEKVFTHIRDICNGVTRIVPITPGTLKVAYQYFSTKIVNIKGLKANDIVGMFYEFIDNSSKCKIDAGKIWFEKDYPTIKTDEVKAKQFRSRFGVFDANDQTELNRMYDTLLSDTERRMNGQFFTPKVWVDAGHEYMAKELGEDWETTVPTWDCCAGTKSLTRDYEFGELYVSTKEQSELNASANLSTEAKETFVFDFLDGNFKDLPDSLKEAMKNSGGKPFAFIINPPYGQATSGRANEHKDGISFTAALEDMKKNGMGKAGLELTVQFLWRILKLVKKYKMENVVLGIFCKPTWFTGDSFEEFRKEWFKHAEFKDGFAFRSEEFEGVSAGWAINFSVWHISSKKNKN